MGQVGSRPDEFNNGMLRWEHAVSLVAPSDGDMAIAQGYRTGVASFITVSILANGVAYVLVKFGLFTTRTALTAVATGFALLIIHLVLWRRYARKRPLDSASAAWPVRFTIHELGVDAEGGYPTPGDEALLRAQLHARSTQAVRHPFLRGAMQGVEDRWRTQDDPSAAGVYITVNFEDVTAVHFDSARGIIDLATDSAGLRLHSTPEHAITVARFLRPRLPLRFWDDLDPHRAMI